MGGKSFRMLAAVGIGALVLLGARAVDAAAPAVSANSAPTPPTGADARIGGSGAPSVVFESALGSGAETWDLVFAKVSEITTAFAYGRPGYGGTALAPSDADGKREADEVAKALRKRLIKAKTPRPYILVGHSLGGLYSLQFAKMYPKDVAGIVLVDGRMPGFVRICAKAGAPCANPGPADPGSPAHIAAEVNGLAMSEKMAPLPGELGDIPVTLITRGVGKAAFLPLWRESHDEFAAGLRNGRHIVAAKSEHYIQNDEPELVIAEIRAMVEKVRAGSKSRSSR